MVTTHFHLTGIPSVGTDVPIRKNFNDFANDADVLNLYLLALQEFQREDQRELLSYFQIGGIHGKPYEPWDGVKGQENPESGGYCTHASVLFPTWHRPYVALYELAIWENASKIANSFKDHHLKSKYQEAAKRLRQPYFDWAADTKVHPLLGTTETVTVVTAPDGAKKEIANPLISYRFHPIHPSFEGNFAKWPQTLRHPSDDNKSQPDRMQQALDERSDQLRDNTFHLFQAIHDWKKFSNSTDSSNSLESIHNSVHNYIGGNGHMGDNGYAGFDPIFFLHHTNVDRLLSLWQAINYSEWVVPGSSDDGTFTIAAGQQVDTNTALTPFHIDDSTAWNSTIARDYTKLGYTYPETCDIQASPEILRLNVIKAVWKLYGPSFGHLGRGLVTREETTRAALLESQPSNPLSNLGHGDLLRVRNPILFPNKYHDWYAVATVNPFQFAKSGYIHIFLCDSVPEKDWLFASEKVGDVAIFRNSSRECGNCNRREAAGETISGRIPLTRALLKRGKEINNVDEIKEYLTRNVHWRCSLVDDTVIPLEDVPSLQVKVCSAYSERCEAKDGFEDLPTLHEPNVYRSITHGKLRGFSLD